MLILVLCIKKLFYIDKLKKNDFYWKVREKLAKAYKIGKERY